MFDWFRKWPGWIIGDRFNGRASITVGNNTTYFDSYDKPYHFRYVGFMVAREVEKLHVILNLWWVTIDVHVNVFPTPKELL